MTGSVFIQSSTVPTYSVGFGVAGYATPTDLWSIIGAAGKIVRIKRIGIGGQATASTQVDIVLIKRSAANTGGTPTAKTAVAHDSGDPAASAAVVIYGSAPTLGTAVGVVRDAQLTLPPPTSSTPALTYLNFEFGAHGAKEIILRIGEVLALNFQGAALPAGMSLSVYVEWTEE